MALVPIAVPSINLVNGKRKTTSKIKGILRPKSISRFKTKLAILCGNSPPSLVSETSVPSGIAIIHEINSETKDIYKVSSVALTMIRSKRFLNIAVKQLTIIELPAIL